MNFYDTLALYMAIMSIYGTVKMYYSIKDRLFGRPADTQNAPQPAPQPVQLAKTTKPHNDAVNGVVKVDKRNKYTVNVAACEAYLASKK